MSQEATEKHLLWNQSAARISRIALTAWLILTVGGSVRCLGVEKSKLSNGAFLVNVRVNSVPSVFLLDSGAEHSVLDKQSAERLKLTTINSGSLIEPYMSESVDILEDSRLCVDEVHCLTVHLVARNMAGMAGALGEPLDGVLGADFLKHFVVELDYASGNVRFKGEHHAWQGETMKLENKGDQFYVPLTVRGHRIELLLDTGTNLSALSSSGWTKVQEGQGSENVVSGVRSPHSPEGSKLICLPKVEVGNKSYLDVVMRVQPVTQSGLFGFTGFDGILGTDFFKSFLLSLDLGHNRLSLASNPRFLRDRNTFSTIGIQFSKKKSGSFTIVAVWAPSPAKASGLHEGDEIIAVNDADVVPLDQEEFSKRIHGRPGTDVKLLVDTGTERRLYSMHVENLLCSSHLR